MSQMKIKKDLYFMPVRIPGMNWKKEQRLKSGSVTVRQNSRLPMEITMETQIIMAAEITIAAARMEIPLVRKEIPGISLKEQKRYSTVYLCPEARQING